jgi:hypothetical protein
MSNELVEKCEKYRTFLADNVLLYIIVDDDLFFRKEKND